MGRNMIIRLGVDASDFTKKMQKAGVLSETTGARIQNAFAAKGLSGISEVISEMEDARKSILDATEGINLSESLSEQIKHTMKARDEIATEQAKISRKLKEAQAMPLSDSELATEKQRVKIRLLKEELSGLRAAYAAVSNDLAALQSVSDRLGSRLAGFASQAGLRQMETEIDALRQALDTFAEAERLAAEGAEATAIAERKAAAQTAFFDEEARKAAIPISEIYQQLRGISRSGRGLNIIPRLLRRIKDSAGSSNNSLEKMVRTIRNVSVVSFGLKIARSLFGELESVTRDYISQNAALQAQVNGLKTSLGQSLAPAIGLVTNALSYLMPYVVGVSNAIGQLMAALFGSGWSAAASNANKTAAATGGAAKAQKELNRQLLGFDQITKLQSNSDSSAGGGGTGAAIAPIEAKTPAWAEHLKKTFTELFESAEFQAANTGGKIGMVLNTAIGEATSALANVDFSGAGSVLAENFNSMIDAIDWNSAGQLIGMALVALPSIAVGFIQSADWSLVGQSVSQFLISSLGTVNEWIRSVDWLQVGVALKTFVDNVDYAGVAQSLATALGLAFGAIGATLWGMIQEPWQEFGKNLRENMELFGGDAVAGFFFSIGEALADVGTWLWENFCKPIIDGVKEGFGIHSPSKVFGDIGTNCVTSLADRFGEGVGNVLQKIADLKSRVTEAAATLKESFSFEWKLPHLRLPHLSVSWEPVDNILAQFFGVTAFPHLSVQWFAKGGILDGAQIFGRMGSTLLGGGERGREAILPLDTNTGWMDDLAQHIAMTLSTQGGGDVNAVINLMVDSEILTTYTIKGLRKRARAGITILG